MKSNKSARRYLSFFRPETVLFALSLWVYAYFYQGGGWNQNSRFDLVRSIVEERTQQIDSYAYNTGDLSEVNGHYYCDKAPGVSWIGVLPYTGFRMLVSAKANDATYLSAAAYFVTVFTVAIPSAVAVAMLWAFLEIFALSGFFKILITLGYALGTLAFPYATLFYGHQPAAALLFSAFVLLARTEARPAGCGLLFGVGALLGLSVSVDYSSALGVVPICVYAACKHPKFRPLLFLALGGACVGILLAIYDTACFGGPFKVAYDFSVQAPRHEGGFMGIGTPKIGVLGKILFSSYRGLFYSAPWLITGIIGWSVAGIKRQWLPEMLVSLAVIVAFCWLNSSMVDWQGGWATGPRYLIPILPFLSAGAAGLKFLPWGKSRLLQNSGLLMFALLAGYSIFMMLAATAVKPEVPMAIENPFWSFQFPAFYHGMLSLNSQSIDSAFPIQGGPHFAWNLGQLCGLKGTASLIPLGMGVVLFGGWLLYITRPADGGRKTGNSAAADLRRAKGGTK